MYEVYSGDPFDKQAKAIYLLQLFHHSRLRRVNHDVMAEEAAAMVWPEYRNSFAFGHLRAPGVKYTQFQVDSSGTMAAWRFMAIADQTMTPFAMMWSAIGTDNDYLMKQRPAQEYFDACTRAHWAYRYRPEANFTEQQQTNWQQLGVLGNQYMLVDALDTKPAGYRRGIRYIAPSYGEIYLLVNHQGRVDGFIRYFRWVARRAYQRWGEDIPPHLSAILSRGDVNTEYQFLQFVLPNTEYDPYKIFTSNGKPWSSTYLSVEGVCILEEGGYYSFPLAAGRYSLAPEEDYGRGPAQQVLPELKSKNSIKEAFLKAAVEGGDPIRLLPEDGLFDFKATAGNYVFGGINEEGKAMVQNLAPGDIKYSQEAIDSFDTAINAAFLTDLYREIFDKDGRPRSAREVVEAINQRNLFLGPLAKQFGYLGDIIRRERVVLMEQGLYPKMPPVVREAKGDYKESYTSPMGRALDGQPIAGFMRTMEMSGQLAQLTGDQGWLDWADRETAMPEIARNQFVPVRWTATPAMMAQKAKARAQQAQQQQYVQSLPGLAAKAKADAISAKAAVGQNIGGTLSGTPQGGMPMLPSVPRGTPGMPGAGGQPGMSGQPAP